MATFKSLSPDDVSRVPFNANKLFQFDSSSATTSSVGILAQTFEYTTSSIDTFSSSSTDHLESIKYYQLDHLFYKNNRLDISNKLGDANYLDEARNLYNKVNVLSIPSKLYGNKIKPGSFFYSGSLKTIVDDSKGNLIISGTSLISHSIDEREKVLFIGPVKGFKQYNVNYNLHGKTTPNPITHYNKGGIYDDSYYNNIINYKNVIFKSENFDHKTSIPSVSFVRNAGNNIVNNGDLEISSSWSAYSAATNAVQTSSIRSDLPRTSTTSLGNFSYQYTVTSTNDGLFQNTPITENQLYEITWDIYVPPGAANTYNQITFTF